MHNKVFHRLGEIRYRQFPRPIWDQTVSPAKRAPVNVTVNDPREWGVRRFLLLMIIYGRVGEGEIDAYSVKLQSRRLCRRIRPHFVLYVKRLLGTPTLGDVSERVRGRMLPRFK